MDLVPTSRPAIYEQRVGRAHRPVIINRHGSFFAVTLSVTGGYRHTDENIYVPQIKTYLILCNGRLIDTALTLNMAKKRCEYYGRKYLIGQTSG